MLRKNFFSLIVAAVILYLSLANSSTFDDVPLINVPGFDKMVHFAMYFGLMSVIIFENRRTIKNSRILLKISIIPAFYGILLEIVQGVFTATRSASIFDALADCLGVLVSVWLGSVILKKFRSDTN